MTRKKTALICGGLLLVAAGALAVVFLTEPEATRGGALKETAMLVEVAEVEKGAWRPTIEAMGTVEAAREIVLMPRVSGEILERSPVFQPGGFVDRGELLVRIDPADLENQLASRRSELRQAIADLELEMGRQEVARRDVELLDLDLPSDDAALALREPQLETARARVEAARAAVEQVELDLARTTVEAPFDAHVLRRDVDVGSQVAPGDSLGRLVGTESYWVIAAVPVAHLRFLSFPSSGEEGSPVRILHRTAWPEGEFREGRVEALLGDLGDRTRLARVRIVVSDPLGREREGGDELPLMIGSFVECRIEGEELSDVVRIDRELLRKDDSVWIMNEEGKLRIRDAEVVFRGAEHAFVSAGLESGDRVVRTNLSTVVDGASLRIEENGSSSP